MLSFLPSWISARAVAAGIGLLAVLPAHAQELMTWDKLKSLAASAALQPAPPPDASDPWGMKAEEVLKIRPRADRHLWAGEDRYFEIELLPPASGRHAEVNLLKNGVVHPVACSADQFDFSATGAHRSSEEAEGFGGLRILAPLTPDEPLQPLAEIPADGDVWHITGPGLSAGTTAGVIGDPADSAGRARFTRWWIEQPQIRRREWIAMALLESPDAAGACRFRLEPGRSTSLEMQIHLVPRRPAPGLLICPLRSRFESSEFTGPAADDWRPEAHSADGLLVFLAPRDALWRPLVRAAGPQMFSMPAPKWVGWGLIQRDRNFDHYQDLETPWHKQPSVWVEPVDKPQAGRLVLHEMPPGSPLHEPNVTAGFQLEDGLSPGKTLDFTWRLQWLPEAGAPGLSRVIQTRRAVTGPAAETWVIDFSPVSDPSDEQKPPQLLVEMDGSAALLEKNLEQNTATGGWRARLRVRAVDEAKRAEVSCALLREGRNISERWSHTWLRGETK